MGTGGSGKGKGGKKGGGKYKDDSPKGSPKGKGKGAKGKGKQYQEVKPKPETKEGNKAKQKGDAAGDVVEEKTQQQRPRSSRKQTDEKTKDFLYCSGAQCKVRKHTEMGCAVVTMETAVARDDIFKHAKKKVAAKDGQEVRSVIKIKGMTLQMRPYVDKNSNEQSDLEIFVAWGRQAEKLSPLPAASVAEAFDKLAAGEYEVSDGDDDEPLPMRPAKAPPPPANAQANAQALAANPQQQQQMNAHIAAAQMAIAQSFMFQQQQAAQQQMMQMMATQMAMNSMGNNSTGTDNAVAAEPEAPVPEKKAFRIIDPKSGDAIPGTGLRLGAQEFKPSSSQDAGSVLAGTAWERKTISIVDPKSGKPIDGISSSGMRVDAREFVPPKDALQPGDYKPATENKAFKIVDPQNGVAIEASPNGVGDKAQNS